MHIPVVVPAFHEPEPKLFALGGAVTSLIITEHLVFSTKKEKEYHQENQPH